MEMQVVFYCAVLFILSNTEPSGSLTVKRQSFYYPHQEEYYGYLHQRPLRQKEKEEQQDFSKIPGVPGVDYPIYHSVPHTNFDCRQVPAVPGMYANVETGCQAYHVCHDGREGHQGASFLCTNGTIFNQKEFACDWWYNVNCHEAPHYYSLNLDPVKNPYTPKAKKEELEQQQQLQQHHPHQLTYSEYYTNLNLDPVKNPYTPKAKTRGIGTTATTTTVPPTSTHLF